MNRHEFLSILSKKLSPLPKEEKDSAMNYYIEYFDEAGTDNEEEIISKLPHPSHIAIKLLAEFSVKEIEELKEPQKIKRISISTIIFAIFSAPVTLPLLVLLVMFSFVGILFLGTIIMFVVLVFASIIIATVFSVVFTIPAFLSSIPTGIYFLGTSLVGISFLSAVFVVLVFLFKKLYLTIKKGISKMVIRRYSHEK